MATYRAENPFFGDCARKPPGTEAENAFPDLPGAFHEYTVPPGRWGKFPKIDDLKNGAQA